MNAKYNKNEIIKKKKNGCQHASKSRNALQSGRENETLWSTLHIKDSLVW